MRLNKRLHQMEVQEKIIVALDVANAENARSIIQELDGLISFYKIGLELLMSGEINILLQTLVKNNNVFIDFKLPNDIPETIYRVVKLASEMGVRFLTLSQDVSDTTIQTTLEARGQNTNLKLLSVPILSSVECSNHNDLLERALKAKTAGIDGFIVSGEEIKVLRQAFPNMILVSPGIRLTNTATHDHKRVCTPRQAFDFGADFLVIGRPVRDAPNKREVINQILGELT